jgi:hypothetical protein
MERYYLAWKASQFGRAILMMFGVEKCSQGPALRVRISDSDESGEIHYKAAGPADTSSLVIQSLSSERAPRKES